MITIIARPTVDAERVDEIKRAISDGCQHSGHVPLTNLCFEIMMKFKKG